mmetsp:Transcript_66908/g.161544  ORF Transcript_66908/g.161544 Transcript_66908/m.161544 type:complete len:811 (-) Transcript_66908:131-2563(-)
MRAAVLLFVAPALGRSTGVVSTYDVLTPKADATGVPGISCDKCGVRAANGKIAAPNCCSDGGSWQGFCDGESHAFNGKQHTHTWHEGFVACGGQDAEELKVEDLKVADLKEDLKEDLKVSEPDENLKPALHKLSSMEVLSDAFLNGAASNDISKVGLIFHGFDQTEDEFAPYKPCTTGYCAQFEKFWPTSIINARQMHAYGGVGILFEPSKNRILCSWPEDDTNRGHGETGCDSDDGKMYRDDELEEMLNISMAKGGEASSGYNEALIDSQMFLDNLPGSIAAVVYGIQGDDGEQAVAAYAGLLSAYNLTETDVPLLKATFSEGKAGKPLKGPVFTDESARAGPRLQQIRDGGVTKESAMGELSRRWRGTGAQQQQQQQPQQQATYTHTPPPAWTGAEHAPAWTGSPLAWEGSAPPGAVGGSAPPGTKEGSPPAWEGSPKAWSAQQQATPPQQQQQSAKAGSAAAAAAADPYGLIAARTAAKDAPAATTVKDEEEVDKFVTGSGPNGVRVAPAMKCLGVDGKPSYCSAQGATRESPARRQEGVALASTPAGDGNEAGATQTHGGPACVLTGCEHGSEKVSENWPDGRNACPCPCPCEVDPSTNQNVDDRVSPSPPPAEVLPAGGSYAAGFAAGYAARFAADYRVVAEKRPAGYRVASEAVALQGSVVSAKADFSSCVSISASADDKWCQASCGGGSCPATVCKCGGAAHLAPDGSPTAPPGTNFKASCKSLHSERLTDDWCDSVCLAADGGQIDTAGGCDPEYCDCPWEQVASTPAEPVTVNRDGSINRGHGKPTPMGPRRFTKTDEKRQ